MCKVLTDRSGSVFVVTINRPDVRNAVDAETAGMLDGAINLFKDNSALRVLVLTGAGDTAFCAGADLKATSGLTDREGSDESGPMGFSRVIDVQKPSIAAINGYCLAGGLELACWCDFRIASVNAKFGVVNRRWGVPLIDGGTQRLPRIVGLSNALYLIEAGVLINADQALSMGLIQEIVPEGQALQRALELADIMTGYPWTSLINDRRAVYEGLTLTLRSGLRREKQLHRESLKDEGLRRGLEKYIRGERPDPPVPP
jgi:enoyl-CoA hydratase